MSRKKRKSNQTQNKKEVKIEPQVQFLLNYGITEDNKDDVYKEMILIRNGIKLSDNDEFNRICLETDDIKFYRWIDTFEKTTGVIFKWGTENFDDNFRLFESLLYNEILECGENFDILLHKVYDDNSNMNNKLRDNFDTIEICFRILSERYEEDDREDHMKLKYIFCKLNAVKMYDDIIHRYSFKNTFGYNIESTALNLCNEFDSYITMPHTKTERLITNYDIFREPYTDFFFIGH